MTMKNFCFRCCLAMAGAWLAVVMIPGSLNGQQTTDESNSELPSETDPGNESPADSATAKSPIQSQRLIVVTGAAGEDEYGKQFEAWSQRWSQLASEENRIEVVAVGEPIDETSAHDQLREHIQSAEGQVERLWIVLIGHGTDDRQRSKFNLVGPDVSATELDSWLKPVKCPVVVVNCASASGSFIKKLEAENRIVITATKSGAQHNFARFGDYLSQAICDPSLDLDKDRQVSLFEAFVAATRMTLDFYDREKRLPSELALIDDNGDGLGTPGDWFVGTRAVRQPKSGQLDGRRANRIVLVRRGSETKFTAQQREQRERLEQRIEQLRQRKKELRGDQYYQLLEPLMLEMARLYEEVDSESEEAESEEAESEEAESEGVELRDN